MKLLQSRRAISLVAIVLSAILVGASAGWIVRAVTLGSVRGGGGLSYPLLAALAGLMAIIGLNLAILRLIVPRHSNLDGDLLEAVLEHTPDNVFFKDRDNRFLRISKAMANYCGLSSPEDAIDKTDADIFPSEHSREVLDDEQKVMQTCEPLIDKEEMETWPDGRETWVLTTRVPVKSRRGDLIGTMGIAHNITERKQAEMRIDHMALHDALTGLPNTVLLGEKLREAIASAMRNEKRVGVLILDLDRFRNVNDAFGHPVGESLLKAVSDRLGLCLCESEVLARMSGDEFVIILPAVEDLEGIERVAKTLLDSFASPFRIGRRDLQMTASVGISQFPEDARSAAELLQYADAAMYEAKKRGRGKYCVFSPDLMDTTQLRQKTENDLLLACARDEFELHYQPIVETASGRISAMEALLRWRHPERGLISPNQFIPELEEMGMMVGVGRWVLMTACRQAVDWQRNGLPPIRMAVNVSAQQFYHGNIVDTVASILRETSFDSGLLELELTESRALDDSEATTSVMRGLNRLGVGLSLDEFGTGWSSLSCLRGFPIDSFPIHRIKIDRSFVQDVTTQPAGEVVLKSILGLGKNLGIRCVAEGVETIEERDYLKKHGCAEMQGFLFSRPLAAVDATALLRSAKSGHRDIFNNPDARRATAHV